MTLRSGAAFVAFNGAFEQARLSVVVLPSAHFSRHLKHFAQGRMLVFQHPTLGKEKWKHISYDTLFVPSSCQALFDRDRDGSSFSNLLYDSLIRGEHHRLGRAPVYFWRPQRFHHKTLTWWFRAFSRFLFRPNLGNFPFEWEQMHSRFQDFGPAGLKHALEPSILNFTLCNTFGLNFQDSRLCSFTELSHQILSSTSINSESVTFGVHIRQGDSCTHRINSNKERPHCQEPQEYANWLLESLILISDKRLPIAVFLMTDTQTASESFISIVNSAQFSVESGFSNISCHHISIDRGKYIVPAGQDMVTGVSEQNEVEFYLDFVADLMLFAASDHIIGQCFSSFMSLGVILNDYDSYTCTDASFITIRGGSPNPYALDCNQGVRTWGVEAFEAHQHSAPLFYQQWYRIAKSQDGSDFCTYHLQAPCYADIHYSSFMLQFVNATTLVRSHLLPAFDETISKEQEPLCF
jgi:hypothetical protein